MGGRGQCEGTDCVWSEIPGGSCRMGMESLLVRSCCCRGLNQSDFPVRGGPCIAVGPGISTASLNPVGGSATASVPCGSTPVRPGADSQKHFCLVEHRW